MSLPDNCPECGGIRIPHFTPHGMKPHCFKCFEKERDQDD